MFFDKHFAHAFKLVSRVKRVALLGGLLGVFFSISQVCAQYADDSSLEPLWECNVPTFGDQDYRQAVELLFSQWEMRSKKPLQPGDKGRVGLKIYTSSGPGLATPRGLVIAVIKALESRGYTADDIFLLDLNEAWIRESGFLPPLSARRDDFMGHEVCTINSGIMFDPLWFYDSPVPPREHHLPGITPMVQEFVNSSSSKDKKLPDDRKSYIASPLVKDVDFWINLPVVTDHELLGLNGALVNATLWNASNTLRFFHSPANAPVAVAEMAAIPEFKETWELTMVSLERYQFIGGPRFNSYYTTSEKKVIMSADPVLVDSYMVEKINARRAQWHFPKIEKGYTMLEYAEALGVGNRSTDSSRIIELNSRYGGKM